MKKFNKKLSLNKTTLASLDNTSLSEVKGGLLSIGASCKKRKQFGTGSSGLTRHCNC